MESAVRNLREKIFQILHPQSDGNKVARLVQFSIASLIILNVLAVILESVESIRAEYYSFFEVFELFSVAAFTLEYLCRLFIADRTHPKSSYLQSLFAYVFSFMALVDLLAILPAFAPLLFSIDLRFLRILRIFRILRLFKLNRYTNSMRLISEVFKEKKADLWVTISFSLVLLVFSASLMYAVEKEAQPEAFPNIPATLWWAVATLTTVGYGDVYPVTSMGKIVSSVIAILGIGIVALPTGILSAAFMEKMQKRDRDNTGKCQYCGKQIANPSD